MSIVLAHSLETQTRTQDVTIEQNVSFESFLLIENVLQGLIETGFRKPSPIQLKAIPIGRCGFDLIVKSKAGTGKTLVFAVVALETIHTSNNKTQVLILAPTREIAVQIQEVLALVGSHIDGLKVHSFIGGLSVSDDKEKCKNCHIAVGTPGRLKHLIKEGTLKTSSVRLFVLDEADKLMEPSFRSDINEIYNSLPNKKQLITTSATYPNELEHFLAAYMLSPTYITAELETPLLLGLKQFVKLINPCSNVVQQMKAKNEELLNILTNISFTQCLVFSNYQTRAESISNFLNQHGWHSDFISAAQSQSQRLTAMNNLKNFKCRILLSTDLTARGIDAANIDLVINYDIPIDAMTYLHRMGRAGRYGSSGVCLNLSLDGAELQKLRGILGCIGGTSLFVPKLPKFSGPLDDLVKLEINPEDCIYGLVSEKETTDCNSVRSKLFDLKISRKPSGNNNIEDEDMLINADTSNLKSCDSGSEKSITTNDTSNLKSVDQHSDADMTDEITNLKNSDTDSIANDTSNLKTYCKNDTSKPDSRDGTDSNFDIMSILNHNKSMVEGVKKQICNLDSASILQSLAAGDFEMAGDDALLNNESNATGSKEPDKDSTLKQLLASISEPKPGHRTTPTASSQKRVADEMSMENVVFCRNLALLNVSKILDEPKNASQVNDDAIEQYLDILKKQERQEVETLADKDAKDILELLQAGDFRLASGEQRPPVSDLENIFSLGYQSIVKTDGSDWRKVMSEIENSECDSDNENMRGEEVEESATNESAKEVEIMKWVPVEETEKRIFRRPRKREVLYEHNPTVSSEDSDINGDAMQWLPAEQARPVEQALVLEAQSSGHYEELSTVFDGCSDELWQNGLCFEDVSGFDEWFHYEWESQVYAIRNYVQQNIYVQEMSKYQGIAKPKKGRDT